MTDLEKRILERLAAVVDARGPGSWHSVGALAADLDEPEALVTAALSGLEGRRLVRRRDFGAAGPTYEIAPHGRRALATP